MVSTNERLELERWTVLPESGQMAIAASKTSGVDTALIVVAPGP
jgi:hypothetical protein